MNFDFELLKVDCSSATSVLYNVQDRTWVTLFSNVATMFFMKYSLPVTTMFFMKYFVTCYNVVQ